MGESAGVGSIFHQITAYGGVKAPFKKAILQSPAFIPRPLQSQNEYSFKTFLGFANVTTLAQAQLYGAFNFGLAPGGIFVRDLYGKLFLEGKCDKSLPISLAIIAAHNSNEAGHYTTVTTSTSDNLTTYMNLYFPNISSSALTYLTETLYPPIYKGLQPYSTPFHRLDLAISDFTISDFTFTCSTNWLGHAYSNKTHEYLFSLPPRNHTEGVPYTQYNGLISTVKNNTVAIYFQKYLTSLSESADPNREGLLEWSVMC